MNFVFKIFGTPYIFDLYQSSENETNYFQTFYNGDKEKTKLTIHRMESGQVSYSYLRYNFLSKGLRRGGFFGMSVVFNRAYCYDLKNLYRLFDAVYETILQNRIILEAIDGDANAPQAKYLVSLFAEAENEVKRIENIISKNLLNAFANDIHPIEKLPPIPPENTGLMIKLSDNKENIDYLRDLHKYKWVSISPEYSHLDTPTLSDEGVSNLENTLKEGLKSFADIAFKFAEKKDVEKDVKQLNKQINDSIKFVQPYLQTQPELKKISSEFNYIQDKLDRVLKTFEKPVTVPVQEKKPEPQKHTHTNRKKGKQPGHKNERKAVETELKQPEPKQTEPNPESKPLGMPDNKKHGHFRISALFLRKRKARSGDTSPTELNPESKPLRMRTDKKHGHRKAIYRNTSPKKKQNSSSKLFKAAPIIVILAIPFVLIWATVLIRTLNSDRINMTLVTEDDNPQKEPVFNREIYYENEAYKTSPQRITELRKQADSVLTNSGQYGQLDKINAFDSAISILQELKTFGAAAIDTFKADSTKFAKNTIDFYSPRISSATDQKKKEKFADYILRIDSKNKKALEVLPGQIRVKKGNMDINEPVSIKVGESIEIKAMQNKNICKTGKWSSSNNNITIDDTNKSTNPLTVQAKSAGHVDVTYKFNEKISASIKIKIE